MKSDSRASCRRTGKNVAHGTVSIMCVFACGLDSNSINEVWKDRRVHISLPKYFFPFQLCNKFLGVPFASPPVGKLRLKPPQPPKEWKPRVRQAKENGALCMQGKGLEFLTKLFAKYFSYSEDCLYLDIFTPNVTLNLPVMVWIHGGGYESGTSVTFPGDILSLQGVVVVVI